MLRSPVVGGGVAKTKPSDGCTGLTRITQQGVKASNTVRGRLGDWAFYLVRTSSFFQVKYN